MGADFIVDITRETQHHGDILSAIVMGQAILRTDGTVPGTDFAGSLEAAWRTVLDGEFGSGVLGLAGTLIGAPTGVGSEVLAGWARRIWDPEAFYNIAVAYHQEVIPYYTYEGTITAVFDFSEEFRERFRGNREPQETRAVDRRQQGQGQLTARVRTDSFMPYGNNEGTDLWRMSGDAMVTGSYRFNSRHEAMVACRSQSEVPRQHHDLVVGPDTG